MCFLPTMQTCLLKIVLIKNPVTTINWCVWAVLHTAGLCSKPTQISRSTQPAAEKYTTSKALGQREVKNYQVTSLKSSAKKSNSRPASQMPNLCRKPKNHNCSNFKTYLQQGLTSPGFFFSLATIISFFLKALSAGMTQLERVSL